MKKILVLAAIIAISLGIIGLAACGNRAQTETANNANIPAAGSSPVTTDAGKAFRVEFKTEPSEVKAGTPASLIFTVKDKQNQVVKDLQIVHEKPMHVLVVSRDLAEFYHIHPEPQADGSYRVEHTFPNGGDYKIYADFTPPEGAQVVEQIDLKATGAERAKAPLVADTNFEKTVEGLKVVMRPDAEIKAGKELMLNFRAFDAASGKPATDLQNYLGELAHFVIISEDMKDFVHAHPMSKGEHDKMSKSDAHDSDGHDHSTSVTSKASASEVAAHTAFPRTGLYKVWAQFQRSGKVITVPFVVNAGAGGGEQKAEVKAANVPAGAIKVAVSNEGFEPSTIPVKKGETVKLAFYRADAGNCGGEVVFQKLNLTRKLPVGETVLVEIASTEAGEISFACGMDMMKGKILVQ
ncbi:MAG: cupredoxin domain-containing protein [Acidobacteriota bacterium]|nr:cupredoxin domain-containing protein [Acidobacteriota bacterium]